MNVPSLGEPLQSAWKVNSLEEKGNRTYNIGAASGK